MAHLLEYLASAFLTKCFVLVVLVEKFSFYKSLQKKAAVRAKEDLRDWEISEEAV